MKCNQLDLQWQHYSQHHFHQMYKRDCRLSQQLYKIFHWLEKVHTVCWHFALIAEYFVNFFFFFTYNSSRKIYTQTYSGAQGEIESWHRLSSKVEVVLKVTSREDNKHTRIFPAFNAMFVLLSTAGVRPRPSGSKAQVVPNELLLPRCQAGKFMGNVWVHWGRGSTFWQLFLNQVWY